MSSFFSMDRIEIFKNGFYGAHYLLEHDGSLFPLFRNTISMEILEFGHGFHGGLFNSPVSTMGLILETFFLKEIEIYK